MNWQFKTILVAMMTTALACGFLHHLVPPAIVNFERLHIFLFNLCSGGTLLMYYTEGQPLLTRRTLLFLALALAFSVCAFMEWYLPATIIPLPLAWLVERTRIDHFGSLLPRALFDRREPVERKFHQAALLCLSCGLALSSPVIGNSIYLHWFTIEKLRLDTFFLGFSFPVSLISMSVIFSLMKKEALPLTRVLKEAAFWTVNLGVIVFFGFILAGMFTSQVAIASLLFVTVAYIFFLYWHEGIPLQQKAYLTSGILFLLVTSLTGISYILLSFSSWYTPEISHPLLRLHAFTALYGWNLSGLAVIGRHDDFPLQLHSRQVILLHWLTVLVLCPLGYFQPVFAVLAVLAYAWLLLRLFFIQGAVDRQLTAVQGQSLHPAPAPPGRK
ncbi:MAG: hypothetical protein LBD10_00430 [Desulfobulbus sp.]|uniref:hypothetical protein n=1 Tax=Desulfobulbus sp. TaxID=895 RepID=UPI00283F25DF|nr:hypothetical protein [Desulfobulbus sp.]MDR2548668.1 hypothetical protein [Desulfobulbus sp.]